jgi:two-component system, LuxR family, sensor kinase FixL
VVRDVTEQARLEEEVRRHEAEAAHFARLASMGEITAGLAHQLNQPLAALVNYARGCVRRLQSGTDDRAALIAAMQEAADQAQRAADVVQHLHDFARRVKPEPTSLRLNQAVQQALEFLRTVVGVPPEIQVHFRPAADLPPVLAVPVRFEQALLNLLRNAVEALQEAPGRGGAVVVTTARQDATTAWVSVRDNAASSPPVDLAQLFVPFYTTKPAGMGIGLPMARSIIEGQGGRLWVQRNPDAGLTFCFTLPFAEPSAAVSDSGAPRPSDAPPQDTGAAS